MNGVELAERLRDFQGPLHDEGAVALREKYSIRFQRSRILIVAIRDYCEAYGVKVGRWDFVRRPGV